MFKIIRNMDGLEEWGNHVPQQAKLLYNKGNIARHVRAAVRCLDEYYGAERDIERDLGGYVAVLYGRNAKEVREEYQRILGHHHLNMDDYEYQDVFYEPECGQKVTFRLYLCSSDYSVQIIVIEEENNAEYS